MWSLWSKQMTDDFKMLFFPSLLPRTDRSRTERPRGVWRWRWMRTTTTNLSFSSAVVKSGTYKTWSKTVWWTGRRRRRYNDWAVTAQQQQTCSKDQNKWTTDRLSGRVCIFHWTTTVRRSHWSGEELFSYYSTPVFTSYVWDIFKNIRTSAKVFEFFQFLFWKSWRKRRKV